MKARCDGLGIELGELVPDLSKGLLVARLGVVAALVVELAQADRAGRARLLKRRECLLGCGEPGAELRLLCTKLLYLPGQGMFGCDQSFVGVEVSGQLTKDVFGFLDQRRTASIPG
jgi:hypothetical protein